MAVPLLQAPSKRIFTKKFPTDLVHLSMFPGRLVQRPSREVTGLNTVILQQGLVDPMYKGKGWRRSGTRLLSFSIKFETHGIQCHKAQISSGMIMVLRTWSHGTWWLRVSTVIMKKILQWSGRFLKVGHNTCGAWIYRCLLGSSAMARDGPFYTVAKSLTTPRCSNPWRAPTRRAGPSLGGPLSASTQKTNVIWRWVPCQHHPMSMFPPLNAMEVLHRTLHELRTYTTGNYTSPVDGEKRPVGGRVMTLRDWMTAENPLINRYPEITHGCLPDKEGRSFGYEYTWETVRVVRKPVCLGWEFWYKIQKLFQHWYKAVKEMSISSVFHGIDW